MRKYFVVLNLQWHSAQIFFEKKSQQIILSLINFLEMLNIHLVTVKFWFPPSCLIENIRRKTLLQCVDFHDVKNRNLKVHFPSLGLNDIFNMDLLAKHYMCRQRLSEERNTMYCPRLISKKNQGYQNSFLILVSSHALDGWYLYPYRIPVFF